MKRLVYNPRIDVYIKADDGVYDISPYVTSCTVGRKVNQVSNAQVIFRNPGFQFTEHRYNDPVAKKKYWAPVFHPQDPIVITMTRLRDRPIQVFTGYCDTTPYFQLFPGVVALDASCTLKRLQYTYWDPGLPFVWDWLNSKGWPVNPQFGLYNASAASKNLKNKKTGKAQLTDSGFGRLLFDFLHEIGNWSEDTIWIENLPSDLFEMISQLFEIFKHDSEQSRIEFNALLKEIIGSSSQGTGAPGGQPAPKGGWVRVGATYEGLTGNTGCCGEAVGGMAYAELLVAGANAGLSGQSLGAILGVSPGGPCAGMPCGTELLIRMPGSKTAYKIHKNDIGSGNTSGDPHYKIDLQDAIIQKLGWHPNADVEVSVVSSKPLHGGGGHGNPAGP